MKQDFTHSIVKAFDRFKKDRTSIEPSEETLMKLRLLARVIKPVCVEA